MTFGLDLFQEVISKFLMHVRANKGEYRHTDIQNNTHMAYIILMLIFQMVLKGPKECLLIQSYKVSTILTL